MSASRYGALLLGRIAAFDVKALNPMAVQNLREEFRYDFDRVRGITGRRASALALDGVGPANAMDAIDAAAGIYFAPDKSNAAIDRVLRSPGFRANPDWPINNTAQLAINLVRDKGVKPICESMGNRQRRVTLGAAPPKFTDPTAALAGVLIDDAAPLGPPPFKFQRPKADKRAVRSNETTVINSLRYAWMAYDRAQGAADADARNEYMALSKGYAEDAALYASGRVFNRLFVSGTSKTFTRNRATVVKTANLLESFQDPEADRFREDAGVHRSDLNTSIDQIDTNMADDLEVARSEDSSFGTNETVEYVPGVVPLSASSDMLRSTITGMNALRDSGRLVKAAAVLAGTLVAVLAASSALATPLLLGIGGTIAGIVSHKERNPAVYSLMREHKGNAAAAIRGQAARSQREQAVQPQTEQTVQQGPTMDSDFAVECEQAHGILGATLVHGFPSDPESFRPTPNNIENGRIFADKFLLQGKPIAKDDQQTYLLAVDGLAYQTPDNAGPIFADQVAAIAELRTKNGVDFTARDHERTSIRQLSDFVETYARGTYDRAAEIRQDIQKQKIDRGNRAFQTIGSHVYRQNPAVKPSADDLRSAGLALTQKLFGGPATKPSSDDDLLAAIEAAAMVVSGTSADDSRAQKRFTDAIANVRERQSSPELPPETPEVLREMITGVDTNYLNQTTMSLAD